MRSVAGIPAELGSRAIKLFQRERFAGGFGFGHELAPSINRRRPKWEAAAAL